jgi:pimeloyl-ACP methyl ester carboxylesterase
MQHHFSYQGYPVYYSKQGEGKAVVLLHGFGEDGHIFDEQVSFLKNHCQVIVPHLPGSGTSIYNPTLTSIEAYAECIHALLAQEKMEACILLGHSMGGYITLAFAELFPDKLNAFGLIHSTAFADSEEKKQNRKRGIEMIEQYGSYPFLKNTIPNLFGKRFKETHPEKVEQLIDAGKAFSKAALQQYYAAMMNRNDRNAVIKGSSTPVLFIMGTEDVAAPLNDVLTQTKLANCSYIHVLQGVGHMGMWEATKQLNEYLLQFINQ